MRTVILTFALIATAALVGQSPAPSQPLWHIPPTPTPPTGPTNVTCCCSVGNGQLCCAEMPACFGSIIVGCMCR